MGAMSPMHWIILAVVVLLLFGGKGKLSGIMGDAAKGVKAFKQGLKEDEEVADNKSKGSLPRTKAEEEDLSKS